MIINNIDKRLKQIQAYDSSSTQSIATEKDANRALDLIDTSILENPESTYLDPQCGSGTLLLYLVKRLMDTLAPSIPNEKERLTHIFKKQIHASDIDSLQVLVCKTNFKKALNDKTFEFNISQADFKDVETTVTCVVSGVQFNTTNDFVHHFRRIAPNTLIITRPNKCRYATTHIHELTRYRFLGVSDTSVPLSAMYFAPEASKKVEFVNDEGSVTVNNPIYLPGVDLKQYQYASEIINLELDPFEAQYGSYYANAEEVVNNPGDVELIYQVGWPDGPYKKTIGVDKSIITPREGVGKHKVVISKNGNRGKKSVLKYAGPEYGTGHNAIWIGVKDKKEAEKVINYYNSDCITALVLALNATSPANGTTFWQRIPHYKNQSIVKKIYDKHYS